MIEYLEERETDLLCLEPKQDSDAEKHKDWLEK